MASPFQPVIYFRNIFHEILWNVRLTRSEGYCTIILVGIDEETGHVVELLICKDRLAFETGFFY